MQVQGSSVGNTYLDAVLCMVGWRAHHSWPFACPSLRHANSKAMAILCSQQPVMGHLWLVHSFVLFHASSCCLCHEHAVASGDFMYSAWNCLQGSPVCVPELPPLPLSMCVQLRMWTNTDKYTGTDQHVLRKMISRWLVWKQDKWKQLTPNSGYAKIIPGLHGISLLSHCLSTFFACVL